MVVLRFWFFAFLLCLRPQNSRATQPEGLQHRRYPNRKSLFTNSRATEHVTQFDEYSVKDFYNIVYDSEKIWVILFYANWCTYSQTFARTYKSVAYDIFKHYNTWENIMNFGVVDCANERNPYIKSKLCMHHICKVSGGKCAARSYPTIKIFKPMSHMASVTRSYIREQNINRKAFTITNLAKLAAQYADYEDGDNPGWSYYWRKNSGMEAPVLDIETSKNNAERFLNDNGHNPATRYVVIVCGSPESFKDTDYLKFVLNMSNYRGLTIYYKECDLSRKTARSSGESFATVYKYCEPLEVVKTDILERYLRSLPGIESDVNQYDRTIGSNLYEWRDEEECRSWLERGY